MPRRASGAKSIAGAKRLPSPFSRRGISLLEVLISIFVLSIGLLGLAALIPVGRFAITEAGIADRSAACGRAGLREVKIREMLDSSRWVDSALTTQVSPSVAPAPGSFAIDPLMIAREATNPTIDEFPYYPNSLTNQPPPPVAPRMTRLTLANVLLDPTGAPQVSLPLAERTFVWQDELLFERPDDKDLRPRRLVRANGVVAGFGPNTPTPVEPLNNANYSWLVTVTPALVEANLPVMQKQLYRVSVVVFYKRSFALPSDDDPKASERTVTANLLGGGYGGGDVRLTVNTQNGSQFAQHLDVKENEWLMLCGSVPYVDAGGGDAQRGVFRWYRVISAGEVYEDSNNPALKCRDVTLAGPDWDHGWCYNPTVGGTLTDLDGDGVIQNAEAALFDGVVGVYTTLVELDWNLLWRK